MRKAILTLFLLLTATLSFADTKITKTYSRCPLPEVLIDIDRTATEVDIRFIYNKLEDYLVSCSLHNATPLEAVKQAIGFYPIKVTRKDSTVIVEPVYDTDRKLIGRVVNEKGQPLEFANIALYSATDSTFITGGVTNKNGDFVVPCSRNKIIAKVTFIGYKPFSHAFDFHGKDTSLQVGTVVMKEDPQTLREVIVEQDLATTSAEKSTYFPTKRQRNAATDATALLQHMMIPQLRINPASSYVTTLSGEPVAIFIDFMPAATEDLEGMNTQDVKRVEIYDFPQDIRFQNNPHVVNFVMQKYEVGGYTKLSSTEQLLADFTSINSVYSKLAHKKWTFDANVTYSFYGQSHLGNESEETFNLPAQTIKRTELTENGQQNKGITSTSLRATYNTEKIQFANRFEILDNNTMKQDIFGSLTYLPTLFNATNSASQMASRKTTTTYKGYWDLFLPKDWSLNLTPELMYMAYKTNHNYREGDLLPTENHIKEKMNDLTWQALLSKTFAQKHTLTLIQYGDIYSSKMNYAGSTIADCEVDILSMGQGARYSYALPKFSFSSYFVYCYSRKNMDGIKQEKWFPAANLSVQFSANEKNNLLFQIYLVNVQADGANHNPTVMKENELMYYCGNTSLKDFPQALFALQHTWMPSNKFTMAAFAHQYYYRNYCANVWSLHNNGTALLRKFDNVGNLHITNLGTSLTLRLFNGNLQVNAYPKLNLYNITGLYNDKKTDFIIDLSANYYLGQFYFMSAYRNSEETYNQLTAAWQRNRSYYYFTAGWGSAHWKARVDIINPFRTDWRSTRKTISTPIYSKISESFNSSSHQRINLTLTYIFNYGKKVKQGNELGTASGGQSSIL